ncbi:MAG: protein kinase [Acidobacteriota bacterium]
MDQIQDREITRLVQSCIGLTSEDRRAFLEHECSGRDELRRKVESILAEETGMDDTKAFHNDYEKALPEHYRLIEMIGRGGMAEVFLAEDMRLSRSVAIKFLNSEFRKDPDRMKRFNQEARAASALNHPNILTIHDIGENHGVQFIVSEYVQGETLSSRISRGKIPLAEAVNIAIQIASALSASHKAGIVHRDIKPDNVMLRHDGTVKVLDFGLAKENEDRFSNAVDSYANTLARALTSPGLILGTPQYMSPEQARGQQLDARTDIFSLGIIVFEMVTGRPPFDGSSLADIMAAILGKEQPRLEAFVDNPPLTLIRIVQKALRKDKSERYPAAEHMLSDLKDLRQELELEPFSGHTTGRTRARTTFHNTMQTFLGGRLINWKLIGLLALLPVAALLAWWVFSTWRPTPPLKGSMRTVPITSWSSSTGELIAAASFSPDARMIAFAAAGSGATEIWVKPVVGGGTIQVTKNGFFSQYPIWSPNGQDIAFFSSRGDDRGIWRTAFTGGEQTQVAIGVGPTARPIFWSENGKIYFQDGSDVFAVDERSGEKKQVTNFESSGLKPRTIEMSRDASAVAYSIKENDLWKVRIMSLGAQTADEVAVTRDQIDHIVWRPDGRSVLFSSSVDGAFQIFETGVGRDGPVQLSNGNIDFLVEDISGDGSNILYGSVNETSDLWMISADDAKQSLVANEVAAEYWADISPDGKDVVYQSVSQVERAYKGSINVRSLTSASIPITVSGEGFSPAWSPNGQWIAYFRRSDTGIGIWRVRSTGAEAAKVADGAVTPPGYMVTPYLKVGINHIAWSPDNASLAYAAETGDVSNIWVAAADGSRNVAITDNKDRTDKYYSPAWSPDGKYIVFLSDYASKDDPRNKGCRLWLYDFEKAEQSLVMESKGRFRFLGLSEDLGTAVVAQKSDPVDQKQIPDSTDIILLSLKTGVKRKVNTLSNAYFHNIHLSRDGKTIAFVSRRDDTTALWTVPVKGGTPKRLLSESDPKVLISSLAWSPDGGTIVFGKQTRTNLLSMLIK